LEESTIAAIATPMGCAGIGVIRISGAMASAIAMRIFRPGRSPWNTEISGGKWAPSPRMLHLGHIIDPEDAGAVIDEVLMAFMPAPFSYTGEDVVEIQAHAGAVVLGRIVALALKEGARLAEPGEFSRRAFMNGRIDLTQAEAIMDLIHARSEASLKIASRQVAGGLRKKVASIIDALVPVLAQVEALIDFPEECEDVLCDAGVSQQFDVGVLSELSALLCNYEEGHLMREGMHLVILGKPNVGKSSLLNRLLQRDRAIVTPIPGTTRDAIEETINLDGLPVRLVDTAGLRESADPVESVGMERTRHLADAADCILLVVDAETGITSADERIYEVMGHKPHRLVMNKIDLAGAGGCPPLPEAWGETAPLCISAKYDQNIDVLKERIYDDAMGQTQWAADRIVPNLRQKGLLEAALQAARAAKEGLSGPLLHPELVAIDLQEALSALNRIIGKNARHDILDDIFSRFCIGK